MFFLLFIISIISNKKSKMNENQEMKECGLLTIQEIIDILGEDFCDYALDVLSASGLYFVDNQIECDDEDAEYLKEQEGQTNVLKNIYDVYSIVKNICLPFLFF